MYNSETKAIYSGSHTLSNDEELRKMFRDYHGDCTGNFDIGNKTIKGVRIA